MEIHIEELAVNPSGKKVGVFQAAAHIVMPVESPKYMIEYKCGGGSHTLRCTHTNFVGMVLGTKADIASYNYFLVPGTMLTKRSY